MRINFILPPALLKAAGGYKVVYQYANFISERGNSVYIYYWSRGGENSKKIPRILMHQFRKLIATSEPKWFKLHKNIKKRAIIDINDNSVRDADITICTSIDTVEKVMNLSKKKGKKIHFVQGHENWFIGEKETQRIYKLDMDKIVVSSYLKEIISKTYKGNIYLVRNGIDTDCFYPTNTHNDNIFSISMMFNANCQKNSEMGIRIFEKLKQEYPKLEVYLFSVEKRPENIPLWINFKTMANESELRDIYNNTAIYCCTSDSEGYGLPSLEAMACGCTLVTTNNKGCLEYAVHDYNSLVSEIRDEKKMYENIKYLFNNPDILITYQQNAYNFVMENNSLVVSCENFYSILNKA